MRRQRPFPPFYVIPCKRSTLSPRTTLLTSLPLRLQYLQRAYSTYNNYTISKLPSPSKNYRTCKQITARQYHWSIPLTVFDKYVDMSDTSEVTNESGIHGTAELTVKISDLKDAERVINSLLEDAQKVAKVGAIEIIDVSGGEEEDEDEDIDFEIAEALESKLQGSESDNEEVGIDAIIAKAEQEAEEEEKAQAGHEAARKKKKGNALFDKDYVDEKMNTYTAPIIRLLNSIGKSSGSLHSFSWTHEYGWWDSEGTRSKEFWSALYAHSSTLQSLNLGFYTHEVHKVPSATSPFSALKALKLDASTAHGDEGHAIEYLLKHAPNLESLEFEYPGCDLDTCQIQGISWDYTFEKLRVLSVDGYDFAPHAFSKFLARCSNVEVLDESVDSFFSEKYENDEDGDDEQAAKENDEKEKKGEETKVRPVFPVDALPNIKALRRGNYQFPARSLATWFDPKSPRRIRHISIGSLFGNMGLPEVVLKSPSLTCLEINGSVREWRPATSDSDSDEETKESERKKLEERGGEISKFVKDFKGVLCNVQNLRELALEISSSYTTYVDGKSISPEPTGIEELKRVLEALPSTTTIRALRVIDKNAEKIPQTILDDFPSVPESLQYLSWEGKEKILYRLEKEDGKVSAEPCLYVRERSADENNWSEKRILEYDDEDES